MSPRTTSPLYRVIPAKAGTQCLFARKALGPGFRRDDEVCCGAQRETFSP